MLELQEKTKKARLGAFDPAVNTPPDPLQGYVMYVKQHKTAKECTYSFTRNLQQEFIWPPEIWGK